MRHFKNFTKTTELTLVQQKLSENCSIQFIQDESGVDWYTEVIPARYAENPV